MQTRPLHMVMLKGNLPEVYGHCVAGLSDKPRVTIGWQRAADGQGVWYVGGQIAESGVARSRDEQIAAAVKDTEKHLFQLRFQSATDRLETPSEIRKAKRDIARLATEVRARELKALAATAPEKINAAIDSLQKGEPVAGARPFTGRRQARRALNRLTKIQAAQKTVKK